ncbi:MAG: hypothetical protein EOP34_01675 [Rickettsiales bacterium]|nr:MAG: hypothetical protein EOP34_01675 [Rickettsiales bacterium]
MNENKSHHPHDLWFKKSMQHTTVAVALINSYLPKEILSKIDLSTLKQQKETFIEKDIGSQTVDCLYQVEFTNSDNECKDNDKSKNKNKNNKIGYIYVLLEQQTKPDRFMAFRLVKYMVSIMEYHRKKYNDDKYLPMIYPIVLYTGLKTYNAPTNLLDLFIDKDLASMMISQFFQLIDINMIEDVEMRKNLYSGTMMYIYKHRKDRAIADRMELIKDNLSVILRDVGLEYISDILKYLIDTGDADKEQVEKLTNVFIELAHKKEDKEKIMTIADNLRQEGEQKGKKEAIEATAINMLNEGCSTDLITKVTGLNIDRIAILKK